MSRSVDEQTAPFGTPVDPRPKATESIRTGSPFAAPAAESGDASGAPRKIAAQQLEMVDVGVARETAGGGVLAAALLVPFAALACWSFPFGGVMVAGLGGALGLFGLASRRPRTSLTLLTAHIALFAISYWKLI